jgi:hypothetical protein
MTSTIFLNRTLPTMREENAWIIWGALILGINLQKSLSIVELFLRHADKVYSRFYCLSSVAYVSNIIAILLSIVIVDYLNAPYPVSRTGFQLQYVLVSMGNNLSSFALCYLLYSRISVFYKVVCIDEPKTLQRRIILVGIALAIISRLIVLVYAIWVRYEVMSGLYPVAEQSPLFRVFSSWSVLANTIDCFCYIPASFLFLAHIARKVRVSRGDFFQILAQHNAVNYLLLLLTKSYILFFGLVGVRANKLSNEVYLVVIVFPLSITYALHALLIDSFDTSQELMEKGITTHRLPLRMLITESLQSEVQDRPIPS